jgi:hypothetical protein
MKPVKLLLKNCMNIGCEVSAENMAFIFSLIESCKLNDISELSEEPAQMYSLWQRL